MPYTLNSAAETLGIDIQNLTVLKSAVCWLSQRIKQYKYSEEGRKKNGYIYISKEARTLCNEFAGLQPDRVMLLKTNSREMQDIKTKYRRFQAIFHNDVLRQRTGMFFNKPLSSFYDKTDDHKVTKLVGGIYTNNIECFFVKLRNAKREEEVFPLGFIFDYCNDIMNEKQRLDIKKEVIGKLMAHAEARGTVREVSESIPKKHLQYKEDAKLKFKLGLKQKNVFSALKGAENRIVGLKCNFDKVNLWCFVKNVLVPSVLVLLAILLFAGYFLENYKSIFTEGFSLDYYKTISLKDVMTVLTLLFMLGLQPVRLAKISVPTFKIYRFNCSEKCMEKFGDPEDPKIKLWCYENTSDIEGIKVKGNRNFTRCYNTVFRKYNFESFKCLSENKPIKFNYTIFVLLLVLALIYLPYDWTIIAF